MQFLCGCATVSFSSDLDEEVHFISDSPTLEKPVSILISDTYNLNGDIKVIEFSPDKFKSEVGAIQASQLFKNPRFLDGEDSSKSTKVAINFKTAWFLDGCMCGSCVVWPMEEQASSRIEFKVFNSAGILIFATEGEISGNAKGTVFDDSKGFRPIRQIFTKGNALLISRSLAKLQASEAFKKLIRSGE